MNRFKIGLILSSILVGIIYLFLFMTHVYASISHKKFSVQSYKKIEIDMYSNYTNEEIFIELTDEKDIEFFKNMFAYQLENNSIKEKKLYDYSVVLTFYSTSSKVYFYKVYFDRNKRSLRPVIFRDKGHKFDPGGYPFILKDKQFRFHEKLLSYLDQS